MIKQAYGVTKKVRGACDDAEPMPMPTQKNKVLAQQLQDAAASGASLLREGTNLTRSRAVLYGLDDAYVEGLMAMASRLKKLHAEASNEAKVRAAKEAVQHAHAATALLLGHVAEAFEDARTLDPTIPEVFPAKKASSVAGSSVNGPASSARVVGPSPPAVATVRDTRALVLPYIARKSEQAK